MEIIRIFETGNQGLYAVKYDDENTDEFELLFDLWQDVEYLENFFNKNKSDLSSEFYGSVSVEEAVMQTIEDARELQKQLFSVKNKNDKLKSLKSFFKPLDNISYRQVDLEKSKAYGVLEKSWIRLYALKLSEDCYIITGGTIKLTRRMGERVHTQRELEKLDSCRDYLRKQGIFDDEGVKDILK